MSRNDLNQSNVSDENKYYKGTSFIESIESQMLKLREQYFVIKLVFKLVNWFPPSLIFVVLCYCYFVQGFLLCYLQFYIEANQLFLASICFLLFQTPFFITILSLLKAVYCDPGIVTDIFYERIKQLQQDNLLHFDEDHRYYISPSNSNLFFFQCSHCDKPKPPRSHHCRRCGSCIRKMDHHCPVINNCVGWGNYKYFMLLLTWAAIICFYGIFCGIMKLIVVGITVRFIYFH